MTTTRRWCPTLRELTLFMAIASLAVVAAACGSDSGASWSRTGSLTTARGYFMTNVLPSGKVLS
jgi:hypothetical protein